MCFLVRLDSSGPMVVLSCIFLDRWLHPANELSQCAGNRRTAMSKTKTVKGVGWDVSAIGTG